MNGWVDNGGRALVDIELSHISGSAPKTATAWIDTGFTGELVLPMTLVQQLRLPQSGTTAAILADGSEVTLLTYECYVRWFDDLLRLQVVANEGRNVLLGIGLLTERELFVSYRTNQVVIE
jgi:clan AA aspartic protease